MEELRCEIAELLAKTRNLSLQAAAESGTWTIATLSPIPEQGSGKDPGAADHWVSLSFIGGKIEESILEDEITERMDKYRL